MAEAEVPGPSSSNPNFHSATDDHSSRDQTNGPANQDAIPQNDQDTDSTGTQLTTNGEKPITKKKKKENEQDTESSQLANGEKLVIKRKKKENEQDTDRSQVMNGEKPVTKRKYTRKVGVVPRKQQVKVKRKRGPKPKVRVEPETILNGQVKKRRGRPRIHLKRDPDTGAVLTPSDLADLADPEEIEKILMTPVEQAVKEEEEAGVGEAGAEAGPAASAEDLKAMVAYEKVRTKPRKERIKKNLQNGHYECPYCSFQSQYYSAVASHTLIHTGEKPYRCRICDYRARQRGHIVVHMRMHSGSKPFRCPDCDYATIQRSHLRVHMQVHSSERPFQCHTCAYRSKHQSILKVHMKKYGHEKAYSCTECTYTTARKHNLLQHMTLHTGLKPYKCDLCPYESNQKGHLNVHIRTHTREKPFKCDECPFASTVPKSLREHMTMHQGKRPLQCPYCSFSTSQPFSIKNHIALHEDTKLFKCKFCSYSTAIEKDFHTHRSIHLQPEAYCCSLCTFKTQFKYEFENHMLAHDSGYDHDIKDKSLWDRKIKMEKLSPTNHRSRKNFKNRLRSTSRKPLQRSVDTNATSPRRAKSPAKAPQMNGHTHMNNDAMSCFTDDVPQTVGEITNLQSPSKYYNNSHPQVKKEVITDDLATVPMSAPTTAPPKAISARRHPPCITDLESSKMHYKVFKQDIIRRKMAGIAKFFCDYCARPFVLHDEWKRHIIRHFMEWPEIEV